MSIAHRTFRLSGLDETFEVVVAEIVEGLSAATRACVTLRLSADQSLDAEAALAKPVILEMLEDDEPVRAFHLIVRSVLDEGDGHEGRAFQVELLDRFGMLELRKDLRTFQEQTSVDIVKKVFGGAAIEPSTCEFQVSRTLPRRVYCVQYRESDRVFSERLLDFEGIFAIPADEPDAAKTIFSDDESAFKPIDGDDVLPFIDRGIGTGVFELDITHSVVTEEIELGDYNYEQPGIDLTSAARASGTPRSARYEYPGGYQTQADGKALANIRLQELLSQRTVARGLAHVARLRPGRTFQLTGTTRAALNVSWLVRTVTHSFHLTAERDTYDCAFEVSPVAQPFRPPRRHPWPVVPGSHSIKVTGPAGEEIHTDSLGRMKGKFFWDREPREDEATCWMRVVQLPIGGSQALARVGWEMVVRYAYGDPDRPIAVARVDNGTHTAPYSYPAAGSSMSFKTLSSPGNGKYNELTIEDGGGGQKFGITASKDWVEAVNNNKTEKIGANEKLDVGTTLDVTVGGNQTVKIGASRTCTVGADAGVVITGDRTKTVGASETVTVGANLTEKVVGSDSEIVGANHVTIAGLGITRTSKGSHALTVGGVMISAAGLGVSVAVAGAKSETVGGAKLVLSGGAAAETVIGAAAVTVGGAIVHAAGGNRMATAKGSSRVLAGGVALMNAAGKFEMKAKKIKMTVAGTANLLGGGGILNLTPASGSCLPLVTVTASSAVKISGNPNMIT